MAAALCEPGRGHRLVNERPHHAKQRAERGHAALQAARRADTEERPHPEAKIEGSGMNEQSLSTVVSPSSAPCAVTSLLFPPPLPQISFIHLNSSPPLTSSPPLLLFPFPSLFSPLPPPFPPPPPVLGSESTIHRSITRAPWSRTKWRERSPHDETGSVVTATSTDVEYGSFTDHGPWQVDPDQLSWKRGLDRVRAAVHASVPELTRYRRVPPVGRMLTTLRALGLPLAVWGARERGKETSTADISAVCA